MAKPAVALPGIRAHQGSQAKAFELLCYFLFCRELPIGAEVPKHFAAPDGGVETKAKLPDGRVLAPQAKFILDGLGTKWPQLDKSVSSAMANHPDVTDYYFWVACDLTPEESGALTKQWNDHVETWTKDWNEATGNQVRFHYVGATEILEKLMQPGREVLAQWFFGTWELSFEALQGHLAIAAEHAGERFRPRFHVDTPFSQAIDAFRLALTYLKTMNGLLLNHTKRVRGITDALQRVGAQAVLDRELRLNREGAELSRFDARPKQAAQMKETETRLLNDILQRIMALEDKAPETQLARYALREAQSAASDLAADVLQHAEYVTARILIAEGPANSGKTHGLLQRAQQHLTEGAPAIFIEAAYLQGNGNFLSVLSQYLQVGNHEDHLLDGLQWLAESTGTVALLVVDGINESGRLPGYWQAELRRLPGLLRKRNRVRVCVSLRSEFRELLVPMELTAEPAATLEVHGLQGLDVQDVEPLLAEYGLKMPGHGILPAAYSNPFLLHLACLQALSQGRKDLPVEHATVRGLLYAMLARVNRRLAGELNYLASENWVLRGLEALATCQLSGEYRTTISAWTHQIQLDHGCSADFARNIATGCIRNGIALDFPGPEPTVRFSFDKLRDVAIAAHAIPKGTKLENVLWASPILNRILESEPERRKFLGPLSAICAEFQARFDEELPTLLEEEWHSPTLASAWLNSLPERGAAGMSPSARPYMEFLLRDEGFRRAALHSAFGCAITDAAPLDSSWLDQFLRAVPMRERDPWLNTVLRRSWQDGVIAYALDSAQWGRAAPKALAWMLASSNRPLRDSATYSLVAAFDGKPQAAAEFAADYLRVDDDYVAERAMAVACGVVLRHDEAAGCRAAAEAVFESVFAAGNPRRNALLLSHAQAILHRGTLTGWTCPDPTKLGPPQGWKGYAQPRELDELETEWGSRGASDKHDRTWFSLAGGGDFDRYIIGTNFQDSDWLAAPKGQQQPTQRQHVERFLRGLNDNQRELASKWRDANLSGITFHIMLPGFEANPEEQARRDQTVESARQQFLAALDAESSKLFREVEPYFLKPRSETACLSTRFMARLTVEEFLQLDYTESHLAFDSTVSRDWRMGDVAQERLGKKHQWIAWHRAVAAADWTHNRRGSPFEREPRGLRDLDPTILPATSPQVEGMRAAWSKVEVDFEAAKTLQDFAQHGVGVPTLPDLLTPSLDGRKWVMIAGEPSWTSPEDASEIGGIRRQAFWHVSGYFVRSKDWSKWEAWAAGANFSDSSLPKGLDDYIAFLGELASPWHDEEQRVGWSAWQHEDDCPVEVGILTHEHAGEKSKDWTGRYTTRAPTSLLQWRPLNRDASLTAWLQEEIKIVDPDGERSSLLVDEAEIARLCREMDVVLVWALVGERFAYVTGSGREKGLPDYRWSGYAYLSEGVVKERLKETNHV